MMQKFTEWTGSNQLFFVKIKNSELKIWKSSLILGKSAPSVLHFYKVSSLSECEKSKKFSSTPSELNLNYVSTLSELRILNYSIISSLSVLIKLDAKNILKIEKREIKGNWFYKNTII